MESRGGGLLTATVLTLIFLPALYAGCMRCGIASRRWRPETGCRG
jgi:Cu/Ag efflux pump CusA